MKSDILSLIDFAKVNTLLEGFNKSTGFVTAVLDLDGNVLSKSGWRQICTDFHRIHPETSKKCTVSDTVLAGKMAEGEKYHFYKCLNGLVDVAVPIVINGEHIANLFSGQFFFEEADKSFFEKQSQKYGFNKDLYLEALSKVPVVSKDEVQNAMEFLLNMTELITDMTFQKLEQQKLIEALKKSESLFQDLVETTQDLIWQCDAEGRYIYLNPAWEEVFGYKAEEMLGKKFTDFQTAEWAERDLKEFRRLLKGNIIKGLETVHIAKNGNEINLIFNAKIVFDENRKAIGSRGSAFNASNIRKTEKELQKKENQYTMLFNSMNEGVAIHEVIFDNNGKAVDYRIVDLNSAFEKHTGIEIEKAKNQKASDFYKTGTAPYLDIYSNVAITAVPTRFETYFPPLNKYFEISVFSPQKAWFATVFTDITERKLMEVAIKKERDEAQLYFDIAGVMFTILNTKGEIVKINKKGCEILGYSDESEILGANWFDVTLPLHVKEDVYEVYNQLMRGKIEAVEYYENPVLTKTGNERLIAFHNTVIYDNDSKISGILFSGEDITDRKNAEDDLKKEKQFLETVFDNLYEGIVACDAEGILSRFNKMSVEFHGIPKEPIPASEWADKYDLYHKDGITRLTKEEIPLFIALKDGMVKNAEILIKPKNGNSRLIVSNGQRLIDSEGKIMGAVVAMHDITNQKKAESALKNSEAKFRTAFKTSPDAVNINRLADGMYIETNEAFSSIMGYSAEETLGKTSLELNIWVNAEDREKLSNELKKYKEISNMEAKFRKKDGTIIIGLMSASIITLNDEPHIISITRDISDMKKAQMELQESERRFRTAFENSATGMCLISTDGFFMQANTSLCKILGYTRSELLNLTFHQITHRDDIYKSTDFVEKAINNQSDQLYFEKRYIRKDGEIIVAKVSSALLRDENDNPLYFITQIIDITESKKAEISLQQSEERYRSLIKNLEAGIVVHAPDTSIVLNNKRASELLGLTDAQLKGKQAFDPHWKFIHEDSKSLELDEYPVNRIINSKQILRNLVLGVVRSADDDIVWLSVNGFPVLNENNEITEVIISFIEITEQISTREEIRKINQQLEKRVIERTAQLEAANKELETFTYSVSHDLKAPLRGIDGYSKLLLDLYSKELNEEARFFINTIRNSTQQMNQLIEDLLEYSRLERSELKNDKIKIKNLINDITSYYKNELIAKEYSLEINVNDIEIDTDEKGLTIVLRNLLENAIKFSSGIAKPLIGINLEEKQHSWVISIKDNGIGFDMKYQKRIFEIFQRLQRAEDFPGTGIGLAIVNKAIQRMNGKVWAESSVGIGSVFYVEIFKNQQYDYILSKQSDFIG